MHNERVFRQLCERSRSDLVPAFDVSGAVLRQIREAQPVPSDTPLAVFAGISAAAAMIVLVYASEIWLAWQDPIAGLLASGEMVLQ